MPRLRTVGSLEGLSLSLVCSSFAAACETLESVFNSETYCPSSGTDNVVINGHKLDYWLDQEHKVLAVIRSIPSRILEVALCQTIELIVERLRRHRSQPGLVKSVQYLARTNLERLDFKVLFSGIRLYGEMNMRCKETLRTCISKMTHLTHLNLTSKCEDSIIMELAKNCQKLEELHVPYSDITDTGLLALCGISFSPEHSLNASDGCLKLRRLGVHDCAHITPAGVGSCLRNLPDLHTLTYGKLVDAIETVAMIDGDYLGGKKHFNITHIDQFNEFYDLESHPMVINLLIKVCPRLNSIKFCTSDEGCKHLSQVPNIERLQLETEDLLNGFRLLIKHYSNLVDLHLTFRSMSFSRLMNIADSCPNLESLEMTGIGVDGSHNLRPNRRCWKKLKNLVIRLVNQEEPLSLLHFLLDYTYNIEEIVVSLVCHVFNSKFLQVVLDRNPMTLVHKLFFIMSPNNSLTIDVARRVIKMLPNLQLFGLKRWNMTTEETNMLSNEIRKQNLDVKLV